MLPKKNGHVGDFFEKYFAFVTGVWAELILTALSQITSHLRHFKLPIC